MRDYVEIGRQARRRGRRSEGAAGVERAWAALASATTTIALEVALGVMLVLEALGGGARLPQVDAARLGVLGTRMLMALLAVNLLAVLIDRGRQLWPRRGGASAPPPALAAGLCERRRLPALAETPPLGRWLEAAGTSRRHQRGRRAFGVSGRTAWLGAALLHLGALLLLVTYTLGGASPARSWLVIEEGKPSEVFIHADAERVRRGEGGLESFTGGRFTLERAEALRAWLAGAPMPEAEAQRPALSLTRLRDDETMTLPIDARGHAQLPDGSTLRLSGAREVATPAAARIEVRGADGRVGEVVVPVGGRLTLPDGRAFILTDATRALRGRFGGSVELRSAEGDVARLLLDAPGLARHQPLLDGAQVRLLGFTPSLEATFERSARDPQPWGWLAAALLCCGAVLLLMRSHTAVALDDEVDRLVLRVASLNDQARLPERLLALAEFSAQAAAREAEGDLAEALRASPRPDAGVARGSQRAWRWGADHIDHQRLDAPSAPVVRLGPRDVRRVVVARDAQAPARLLVTIESGAQALRLHGEVFEPDALEGLEVRERAADSEALPASALRALIAAARRLSAGASAADAPASRPGAGDRGRA